MSDFDVSVRRTYRDIKGMAFLGLPNDFQLENGEITRWFNRATQLQNRLGDMVEPVAGVRPTVGANGGANFLRGSGANGSRLDWTVFGDITGADFKDWTFGFRFVPGANGGQQRVFQVGNGAAEIFKDYNGANAYGFFASSILLSPGGGAGSLAAGAHLLAPDGTTLDWKRDNVDLFVDGQIGIGNPSAVPLDTDPPGWFGDASTADSMNGEIVEFVAWARNLSTKEQDFLFQSFNPAGDTSAGVGGIVRATVQHRIWNDRTGDLTLRQQDRLNPLPGRQHQYVLATIPSGESSAIVQIACNSGRTVLPDSDLGGDLYQVSFVEAPTLVQPPVTQDAGWSSIFDVQFSTPGHYTLLFERPNHGAMYVHLDVEQAA